MKRKIVGLLVFIFALATAVLPSLAVTPENAITSAQRAMLDERESRIIAPLDNAENLTEDMLDKHLLLMGFNEDEISRMSVDVKTDIASNGGVKIESSDDFKLSRMIVDEKGNTMEITDQDSLSLFADWGDNDFELAPVVLYNGYTSDKKNYLITLYLDYYWEHQPVFAYTDKLAMGWQYVATAVGPPESKHYHYPKGKNTTPYYVYNNAFTDHNYGNEWAVDVQLGGSYGSSYQFGYAKQQISVPASVVGTNATFEAWYAHKTGLPIGSIDISITIGGFVGIGGSVPLVTWLEYGGRVHFNY